ncbi:MAG: DUF3618 domain-containing protein [Arachnia sp.]
MSKDTATTVKDLRERLATNRAQMSASVSDFVEEVKPSNVAKRGVEEAKGFVTNEFEAVKRQVKDDDGWRTDRLMIIGGAVLGVIVFAVTINAVASRSRQRQLASTVRAAVEAQRS